MNFEWKRHEELNNHVDQKNYLVTWQNSDGCYEIPHMAYWSECEQRFFPSHTYSSFPLDVDFYCEYPDLIDKQ